MCICVEQVNLHDAFVWFDANREKSDPTFHFFSGDGWTIDSFRGIAKYLYFCNMSHLILSHVLLTAANDHLCSPNHIALWLGKVESPRIARIWWTLVSILIFCRSIFSWKLGIRFSFLLYDPTNEGKSISKPFQLIMRIYRKLRLF
jgi:hypothetical protein